ncbi:metallophosphoesterase [Ferrimonas balearica]|uniref:metallophosphoesterase n=1 Tax=Ferrimonas balearica TaxID=44012 RepID=UPI001C996100|nr:metallophosphoesterase [Ferrimonas balearica]MBY5991724.1 metallophosphoesterase [Ferrimonas balearica]
MAYDILLSDSPDRSDPRPLAGASVSGPIYVFISPDTGLDQVQFFIDGSRVKTENVSPWDLGGTASDRSALPFDADSLADGPHQMSVTLLLDDGSSETRQADFQAGDAGPTLVVSPTSVALQSPDGGAVSDQVDVAISDGSALSVAVSESLPWLSVTPTASVTPFSLTLNADPSGLTDGVYEGQVNLSADGVPGTSLTVRLSVGETSGDDAPQLHLTWDHAQNSFTAVWFTPDNGAQSELQYRLLGSTAWQSVIGSVRHSNEDGWYHQASVATTRGATYQYRVRLDSTGFSRVYQVRAHPAADEPWDLTFVADTGLLGRLDGLTNGTQAVIDAMKAIDPHLILLGGDYAYYDKDKRYGTLERTIDAWFNQMAPLAPYAPMMPIWGNHEILNNEGFEFWHARFPTPDHWEWDGGRMYAFDVGDVHFVGVFALRESNDGIPLEAVAWLENHLNQVKDAGYRWIIPYLHAAPFSDGSNHVSAETIRGHVAPLFEAAGVKLVLSAHDQSYERTYPLLDAAGDIVVTTTDLDCYDRSQGITWMKISPGGKMSDKNGSFSEWLTVPPPYWTARRDNTAHHFGHLEFDPGGDITVSVYQVTDGETPTVFDQFRLTEDCNDEGIAASPAELSFSLAPDEQGTQSLTLSLTDAGSLSVSEALSWLSVNPSSGASPLTTSVTADSTGLVDGIYRGTLNVTGNGLSRGVPVSLTVSGGGYQLVRTEDAQRNGPSPMNGASVSGEIFVQLLPEEGVQRVRFYIDGSRVKTEGVAPFDIGGTEGNDDAKPFSLAGYADGPHQMRADLELSSGSTASVFADFTIGAVGDYLSFSPASLALSVTRPQTLAQGDVTLSGSQATQADIESSAAWLQVAPNPADTPANLTVTADSSALSPGRHSATLTATSPLGSDSLAVTLDVLAEPSDTPVLLSLSPDRSGAVGLDGQSVSGLIYVFVDADGADRVRFYLNDPGRSSPTQTEYNAPWDLAGTNSDSARSAKPFDTATLSTGSHTLEVEVVQGGSSTFYQAVFNVTR